MKCRDGTSLGVKMDSILSFDKHNEDMCNKVKGLLYFSNRHKLDLNYNSRVWAVEVLVNSLVSYNSLFWSAKWLQKEFNSKATVNR